MGDVLQKEVIKLLNIGEHPVVSLFARAFGENAMKQRNNNAKCRDELQI